MEIYATDVSGVPTTLVASTTIADSTVPTGDSRIVGTFASGVSLQMGVTYALSLKRAANWNIRDRGTDPCPGHEFRSLTASGAWDNDGGYVGDPFDFVFRVVYGDAPGTSTPPATGLRAAALTKCKKRAKAKDWSHKRLRHCKKKAQLLPL